MKIHWLIIVGIILGSLLVGLLVGTCFPKGKQCVQEITKEQYCQWIGIADSYEDLIIAQDNLFTILGVEHTNKVRFDMLQIEMIKCGNK